MQGEDGWTSDCFSCSNIEYLNTYSWIQNKFFTLLKVITKKFRRERKGNYQKSTHYIYSHLSERCLRFIVLLELHSGLQVTEVQSGFSLSERTVFLWKHSWCSGRVSVIFHVRLTVHSLNLGHFLSGDKDPLRERHCVLFTSFREMSEIHYIFL